MLAEFQPLLEDLKSEFQKEKNLKALVVFGSVARETSTEDSDIDLAIFLRKEDKGLEEKVSKTLLDLEKKHRKNIQLVLLDSKFEGCDRQLLDTILREGVTLLGRFPPVPIQKLGLEAYSIIKYDLTSLSQPDKMRVKRLLYGKRTTKKVKGKTYVSETKGLIQQSDGIRVGIASILLPEKKSWAVEKQLRELGATTRKIGAWLAKA